MTWSLETSNGFESDKIAALVVPYTRGVGLDIGCGMRRCWPHMIGVDSGHHFGARSDASVRGEGDDLSMFADGSMDFVFSSHLLEHFPREKVPAVLAEWARALKVGGHLVLYVPSANLYPRVGELGANPDHKWDIHPGDIEEILEGGAWTQLECEERDGTNEYSLFLVFRKEDPERMYGVSRTPWGRNPGGKKRCLVIRYGAIGDQIMVSSILPELKKQGWHVTYNTTPDAQQILLHDPNIDEWLLQDKDQVPNEQLGPYWDQIAERYDKVINLCESIEKRLLATADTIEDRMNDDARRRILGNVNYLERTHDLAGVPHAFHSKFYPSDLERVQAEHFKRQAGGPVVLWTINGSSNHKVYPFTNTVIRWLLDRTPARIVLTADPGIGKVLQDAIMETLATDGADMKRIWGVAGIWPIRQALAFAQVADVVVGPETGVLNAVALDKVPKVIYLSHSSATNLTKHWRSARTITPPPSVGCHPCHRLHYDWSRCHKSEATGAALCASEIKPEGLFRAIAMSLGAMKGS